MSFAEMTALANPLMRVSTGKGGSIDNQGEVCRVCICTAFDEAARMGHGV